MPTVGNGVLARLALSGLQPFSIEEYRKLGEPLQVHLCPVMVSPASPLWHLLLGDS